LTRPLERFQEILSVAKVHKLRSERKARTARDWLTSDEPEAETFLNKLTEEMMDAGTLINQEQFRLAAVALGVNFDDLLKTTQEKRDEALQNLKEQLERESVVLTDAAWDAKEEVEWRLVVDLETEEETLR
jgi:acyl-CoA reductase-like NAD-dependent aldehyde dehydrogenase